MGIISRRMFGPREGEWFITCKSDPNWNASGRGVGYVSTGGPQELHDKIAELKKQYGDPPDDVKVGFMKD